MDNFLNEANLVFLGALICVLGLLSIFVLFVFRSFFPLRRQRSGGKRETEQTHIDIGRVNRVLDDVGNRSRARAKMVQTDLKNPVSAERATENGERTVFGYGGQTAEANESDGDVPDQVMETVSVVLRRRVPINDGSQVRSWIGGLPMMPEGTPWPRSTSRDYPDKGPIPLHFAAQINCADLLTELWGGFGPREGWLLFFLDPNTYEFGGDHAGFKVLHTTEPGRETNPPADIGPVFDGAYAGPDYRYLTGVGDVPTSWRRWPVDLVVVPNKVEERDGYLQVTPENFAAELYGGAEVTNEWSMPVEPFTASMLIAALSVLEKQLKTQPLQPKLIESVREGLDDPKEFELFKPDLEALEQRVEERRKAVEAAGDAEGEQGQKDLNWLNKTKARLESEKRRAAVLEHYSSGAALADYCLKTAESNERWRQTALEELRRLILLHQSQTQDTPLADGMWPSVKTWLEETEVRYFNFDGKRNDAAPGTSPFVAHEKHVSLWEIYSRSNVGPWEFVSDYYADPDRRHLIPAETLTRFEPWWRQLCDNRPHRMGGEFDALQSSPQKGPSSHLTMLHLASDKAMNWMWGDVGIVFFTIRPKDLAEGRFERVSAILECH